MPMFSFIVPVYNGAHHLRQCLDSILSQTYGDLELICINDASTDGSAAILDAYAVSDTRIRVIHHAKNGGSARSRRCGVLESRGSYVLFADQDDTYVRCACKKLHARLTNDPVDVLHFGTKVVRGARVDKGEAESLELWLAPHNSSLHGRALLQECFVNLQVSYSLWNKAYQGDLARRAFAATRDVPIALGEDNYASFVLYFFAKTYRSIPDQLYHYHYGRGYTGCGIQRAVAFKRTCQLIQAAVLIHVFLREQKALCSYGSIYRAARKHMLHYVLDRWKVEVVDTEALEALRYVIDAWPYPEVLVSMAADHPGDLPLLFEARFGQRSSLSRSSILCSSAPADEGDRKVACGGAEFLALYHQLEELGLACGAKDARLQAYREGYEASLAYRWGRRVLAPLRFARRAFSQRPR